MEFGKANQLQAFCWGSRTQFYEGIPGIIFNFMTAGWHTSLLLIIQHWADFQSRDAIH